MAKKIKHNYKTKVKIKLAADVLRAGFWMGDVVDFLESHDVEIAGDPRTSSKFWLARSSMEAVKDTKKLEKLLSALLQNKYWYYSEPTKELSKLAEICGKPARKNGNNQEHNSISLKNLHPEIRAASGKLFEDRHYSQAIFEAFKTVVNKVKSLSGLKEMDGKALMDKAFSLKKPILRLNELKSQSQKDEQLGFMLLFGGAVLGIRNPKAHDNITQKDPIRTLKYLGFSSLLLERLEEAKQLANPST